MALDIVRLFSAIVDFEHDAYRRCNLRDSAFFADQLYEICHSLVSGWYTKNVAPPHFEIYVGALMRLLLN